MSKNPTKNSKKDPSMIKIQTPIDKFLIASDVYLVNGNSFEDVNVDQINIGDLITFKSFDLQHYNKLNHEENEDDSVCMITSFEKQIPSNNYNLPSVVCFCVKSVEIATNKDVNFKFYKCL